MGQNWTLSFSYGIELKMCRDHVRFCQPKACMTSHIQSTKSSINKWNTTLYQDHFHHSANFCSLVLNMFSKKLLLTARNVVNKFWSSCVLVSTGKIKLMMPGLWTVNFVFSSTYRKLFFWYFSQLLIVLTFTKFIKDFKILYNLLVQDFCLKIEFAWFPTGFRLKA